MKEVYKKSGFVIIIAPQESFWPSSSSSFYELSIIKRLDFFIGAAQHWQYRQTNGADSQGRWPFFLLQKSLPSYKIDKQINPLE